MHHLLALALLIAAVAVQVLSYGPLFFGFPIVGAILLLCGLILESVTWIRWHRSRR
jgi:hypothetical protein